MPDPNTPPPPAADPTFRPAAPATTSPVAGAEPKRHNWLLYGCITLAVIGLIIAGTMAGTAWWVKRQLNPAPITPTHLTEAEQRELDQKLESLGHSRGELEDGRIEIQPPTPEELDRQRRTVRITEKELNGMLANNTEFADEIAIELSRDTIRARSNIPIPEDFPVLGGKTIRVKVAMHALLVDNRIQLRVSDVSLGGLPLPNAWLGGIKDKDLVDEYAKSGPFKAFVDGIENLSIENGEIVLTVNH